MTVRATADRPGLAARYQVHAFGIMAQRDAAGVRLSTRNGHDFSKRFAQVVAAVAALAARSCLIDSEAIVSAEAGLAVFELLRSCAATTPPCSAPSTCSSSTARTCAGCRGS
jgi:bifunctional non-homologous end joining protein LigD